MEGKNLWRAALCLEKSAPSRNFGKSIDKLHGTMKLVSTTCPWVHAPRKILKQKTYISCNSMTQIRAGYYSS